MKESAQLFEECSRQLLRLPARRKRLAETKHSFIASPVLRHRRSDISAHFHADPTPIVRIVYPTKDDDPSGSESCRTDRLRIVYFRKSEGRSEISFAS